MQEKVKYPKWHQCEATRDISVDLSLSWKFEKVLYQWTQPITVSSVNVKYCHLVVRVASLTLDTEGVEVI